MEAAGHQERLAKGSILDRVKFWYAGYAIGLGRYAYRVDGKYADPSFWAPLFNERVLNNELDLTDEFEFMRYFVLGLKLAKASEYIIPFDATWMIGDEAD